MVARGLLIDRTGIYRWVKQHAPIFRVKRTGMLFFSVLLSI
jgi:hypothetical protein